MSKASADILNKLHDTVATRLLDIITNGVPSVDKDGNVVREPASAAYIAAAIKFLKDNGIEGIAEEGSPLGHLKAAFNLPFEGSKPSH